MSVVPPPDFRPPHSYFCSLCWAQVRNRERLEASSGSLKKELRKSHAVMAGAGMLNQLNAQASCPVVFPLLVMILHLCR